jgi:hypothetical protein
MSLGISTVEFIAGEATTVTEKTAATVKEAVKDLGEKKVGAVVIEAAGALAKAAEPLADAEEITFDQRREVDVVDDRAQGGLYTILTMIVRSFQQSVVPLDERQQAQLEAALLLLAILYSEGVEYLRGRWAGQYGATSIFLDKVHRKKAVQKALKLLALDTHTDLIESVHHEYGRRMGYTTAYETPTALAAWHEALEAYLAAVFTNHKPGDLRDRLTAPYEELAVSVAAARRRRPARSDSQETGEKETLPDDKSAIPEPGGTTEPAPGEGEK